MNETKRNLRALLAALAIFFSLLIILKWHFLISAGLALGVYAGVYLINKPRLMIGDTDIEAMENSEQIKELYQKLEEDYKKLNSSASTIKDPSIKQKSKDLVSVTNDIKYYLAKNPRQISKSRHFLDYYIGTACQIVDNYKDLDAANLSQDKFLDIKKNTSQSLDLLIEIFERQRDGYHKDKINKLEVETDLLEKTIKLGGDSK